MSHEAIYAVKEEEGMEVYLVCRKDIYETIVAIRATSPEEAIAFVKAGMGHYSEPEHYSDIDSEAWTVEKDGSAKTKGS